MALSTYNQAHFLLTCHRMYTFIYSSIKYLEVKTMELMKCVHPFKINGKCEKNIDTNSLLASNYSLTFKIPICSFEKQFTFFIFLCVDLGLETPDLASFF
jgi:hypothetical protein